MGNLTLTEIEAQVNDLAQRIKAPENNLPTYRYSTAGGNPHIEVDQRGYYHYVRITERGQEIGRTTWDLDELLFWVFQDVTVEMAIQYELQNRIPNQDFRRIYFAKQEELLELLNPRWGEKQKEIHADILKEHPFDDSTG